MFASLRARALSCALIATLPLTAVAQQGGEPVTGDLGHVLPGQLHGGFLTNLHLLMHDFPGIVHEGWLGDLFDGWVEKGWPDPREQVDQIALGCNISQKKLVDFIFLARGPLRVAAVIKKLAEQSGLPIREWTYRGIHFVRPLFERLPIAVAEVTEGVSHFHYDRNSRFAASKRLVETALGQNVSFGEKHGMSLTPVTYVVAGVQVPAAVQEELRQDPSTQGFGLVGQAAVDWRRTGTKVQIGIELETWTPVEARLLADWLKSKLEGWIAAVSNPYLKRFLQAFEIDRVGKHVFLRLKYEWDLAQEAMIALNLELPVLEPALAAMVAPEPLD
jgi:hypothetical protein